jgi:hypothetical protein
MPAASSRKNTITSCKACKDAAYYSGGFHSIELSEEAAAAKRMRGYVFLSTLVVVLVITTLVGIGIIVVRKNKVQPTTISPTSQPTAPSKQVQIKPQTPSAFNTPPLFPSPPPRCPAQTQSPAPTPPSSTQTTTPPPVTPFIPTPPSSQENLPCAADEQREGSEPLSCWYGNQKVLCYPAEKQHDGTPSESPTGWWCKLATPNCEAVFCNGLYGDRSTVANSSIFYWCGIPCTQVSREKVEEAKTPEGWRGKWEFTFHTDR